MTGISAFQCFVVLGSRPGVGAACTMVICVEHPW